MSRYKLYPKGKKSKNKYKNYLGKQKPATESAESTSTPTTRVPDRNEFRTDDMGNFITPRQAKTEDLTRLPTMRQATPEEMEYSRRGQEYDESFGQTSGLGPAMRAPLRYMENPLKFIGEAGEALGFDNNGFPTTEEDEIARRIAIQKGESSMEATLRETGEKAPMAAANVLLEGVGAAAMKANPTGALYKNMSKTPVVPTSQLDDVPIASKLDDIIRNKIPGPDGKRIPKGAELEQRINDIKSELTYLNSREPMVPGAGLSDNYVNSYNKNLAAHRNRLVTELKENRTKMMMNNAIEQHIHLETLPSASNNNALAAANNFKQRVGTPEGLKRLDELGIDKDAFFKQLDDLMLKEDPSKLAYFGGGPVNLGGKKNFVSVNKNIPNRMQGPVTRHEIEHFVQSFKEKKLTSIDEGLGELTFRPGLEIKKPKVGKRAPALPPDKAFKKPTRLADAGEESMTSKMSNRQDAINYFDHGSGGGEKSAFLSEIQQFMLENNIIKHAYDKITPELVKKARMVNIKKGGFPLRLFRIIDSNNPNNYKVLSTQLNKMLSVTAPIGIGAGALNAQEDKPSHLVKQNLRAKYSNGRGPNNLSKKDLSAYSDSVNQEYKDLNWVKRGLEPEKHDSIINPDGKVSSHELAYSGGNGEYYVYPTIIENPETGMLERLSPTEAWEHARKTKTAIRFSDEKVAEYYSKNGLIKHKDYKHK